MKKIISITLFLTILLTLSAPTFGLNTSEPGLPLVADIKNYSSSYFVGNSIISDDIIQDTAELDVSANSTSFSLGGTISGKQVAIGGVISNKKVLAVSDSTSNFEFLSLQSIGNSITAIMKDCSALNVYFVNFTLPGFADLGIENYNPNWYASYVTPSITEVVSSEPKATSTFHTKEFSSTTNVYGDIYKERLVVGFAYEWDANFSGTGAFKLNCGVNRNFTEHTPYGGSMRTLNGSSLVLYSPYLLTATPKGDYISSISTNFIGTYTSGGGFHVNFSAGIPNTGFSISWTLPGSFPVQNGESGYFTFPGSDANKATQANVGWAAANYTCKNPSTVGLDLGDSFEATAAIKYADSYAVHNTSKSFISRWDFKVYSTGNNNGLGVNSYVTSSNFTNTLYYSTRN